VSKNGNQNRIKSISFPALSTGVYGYPLRPADRIALETVIRYLKGKDDIKSVHFVQFNQDNYQLFKAELQNLLSAE
jgi:O-acetyl-ADP-ribose deacetylase (regulator of RNase III)